MTPQEEAQRRAALLGQNKPIAAPQQRPALLAPKPDPRVALGQVPNTMDEATAKRLAGSGSRAPAQPFQNPRVSPGVSPVMDEATAQRMRPQPQPFSRANPGVSPVMDEATAQRAAQPPKAPPYNPAAAPDARSVNLADQRAPQPRAVAPQAPGVDISQEVRQRAQAQQATRMGPPAAQPTSQPFSAARTVAGVARTGLNGFARSAPGIGTAMLAAGAVGDQIVNAVQNPENRKSMGDAIRNFFTTGQPQDLKTREPVAADALSPLPGVDAAAATGTAPATATAPQPSANQRFDASDSAPVPNAPVQKAAAPATPRPGGGGAAQPAPFTKDTAGLDSLIQRQSAKYPEPGAAAPGPFNGAPQTRTSAVKDAGGGTHISFDGPPVAARPFDRRVQVISGNPTTGGVRQYQEEFNPEAGRYVADPTNPNAVQLQSLDSQGLLQFINDAMTKQDVNAQKVGMMALQQRLSGENSQAVAGTQAGAQIQVEQMRGERDNFAPIAGGFENVGVDSLGNPIYKPTPAGVLNRRTGETKTASTKADAPAGKTLSKAAFEKAVAQDFKGDRKKAEAALKQQGYQLVD